MVYSLAVPPLLSFYISYACQLIVPIHALFHVVGTADAASALGLPTTSSLTVIVRYPNGVTVDFTGDPRVTIDAVAANNLITLNASASPSTELVADASGAGGTGGVAVVSVRLSHLPSGVVASLPGNNVSVTVVTITSSQVYVSPWPEYPGSDGADALTLNRIALVRDDTGNGDIFQQAVLRTTLTLSDGSAVNASGVSPHVQYRIASVVSGDPQAFVLSSVEQGRTILSVTSEAVADIDVLVGTHLVAPVRVTSSLDPVYVTRLAIVAGAYDTLRGARGIGHADMDVSAEFTDGTEYESLFTSQGANGSLSRAPMLPGVFTIGLRVCVDRQLFGLGCVYLARSYCHLTDSCF